MIREIALLFLCCAFAVSVAGQCPQITGSNLSPSDPNFCTGEQLTFTLTGTNLPAGDAIQWYISTIPGFNPYSGQGTQIGSSVTTSVGIVAPFTWNVPANFCMTSGAGFYNIVGILNPPPGGGCPEIFTQHFEIHISCPVAVLSGDIVVCSENCPDDPGLIIFEFSGGIEPYTVNAVVSAFGLPPFPINGVAFDGDGQINVCIGGIFPSFDPSTQTLTIPEFLIGQQVTITLQSIVDDAGCVGTVTPPGTLVMGIYARPTANAGPNTSICGAQPVSLNGSIGGSAETSLWITSGDGTFGNPQQLNTTYTPGSGDVASGMVTLTLVAFSQPGTCDPDSAFMTITILSPPSGDAGADQIICADDVVQLLASLGGSATSGTWSSSGDGSFSNMMATDAIYTPGGMDISNGSVILTWTTDNAGGICVADVSSVTITLIPPPMISGPSSYSICAGDLVFISVVVGGDAGNAGWTTSGDGIFDNPFSTTTTYDPGTQDIQNGFVTLTCTVLSSTGICSPVMFTVTVSIQDCACPSVEVIQPSDPLCNADGILDLFTLLITQEPGTWQITGTPPGSAPASLSGGIFDATNADPGIYSLSFVLNFPEPNCPPSSTITLDVVQAPDVYAGDDQLICAGEIIMLSGQFAGDQIQIMWSSTGNGQFADPFSAATTYVADSAEIEGGILTLILSGSDVSGICPSVADTIIVALVSQPGSPLVTNSTMICNDSLLGAIVDLYAFVGDSSGTWIALGGIPLDLTDPSEVNFDGWPEGIYLLQYTVDSAPPCAAVSDTLAITVAECDCPTLMIMPLPGATCNVGPGLDLNAFLIASMPGSWTLTDAPAGAMPAILDGSVLQTADADGGDYTVLFGFDVYTPGCTDSVSLTIRVVEQLDISAGPDTTLCSDEILQLSGFVSGAGIVQWSSSGDGAFIDPMVSGTSYAPGPQDIQNGYVSLTLSAIDSASVCPVSESTLLLTIIASPFAMIDDMDIVVCNNADSVTVVSFIDLVIGGDMSGTWTDAGMSAADLSDLSAVNFIGLTPGSYVFHYTTASAVAPCDNRTYQVMVSVRDCTCPSIVVSDPPALLCAGDIVNLEELLIDPDAVTWSVFNPAGHPSPPSIAQSVLQTTQATPGTYLLEATLTDSIAGCPQTTNWPLTVAALPGLFIAWITCDLIDSVYHIVLTSDADMVTSDAGTISAGSGDTIKITGIDLGQDVLITLQNTVGSCTSTYEILSPQCGCTLELTGIPSTLTLCAGDSMDVTAQISGASGPSNYRWITPQDTIESLHIAFSTDGVYRFVVEDALGCRIEQEVLVMLFDPVTAFVETLETRCADEHDGALHITSITPVGSPYFYALSGNVFIPVDTLPWAISNLSPGMYVLQIKDINGCISEMMYAIGAPPELIGNLGGDRIITPGDSFFIDPQLNFIPESFAWDPPLLTTLSGWILPGEQRFLFFTATDSAGCVYRDSILITLLRHTGVFAPTVFSPNGDQVNDRWTIYAPDTVAQLRTVRIFDRWGGLLWEAGNMPVNSPSYGWDGTYNDRDAPAGVYVFHAVLEMSNGERVSLSGDLTLLR